MSKRSDPLSQLKAQMREQNEHLTWAMRTRESVIRQNTIIEEEAHHARQQETLMREAMANLVLLFGTGEKPADRQLVLDAEGLAELGMEYAPGQVELVTDVGDDGSIIFRVRIHEVRAAEVEDAGESVLVQIGEAEASGE